MVHRISMLITVSARICTLAAGVAHCMTIYSPTNMSEVVRNRLNDRLMTTSMVMAHIMSARLMPRVAADGSTQRAACAIKPVSYGVGSGSQYGCATHIATMAAIAANSVQGRLLINRVILCSYCFTSDRG